MKKKEWKKGKKDKETILDEFNKGRRFVFFALMERGAYNMNEALHDPPGAVMLFSSAKAAQEFKDSLKGAVKEEWVPTPVKTNVL